MAARGRAASGAAIGSPRDDKATAILAAAETLFSRYGFRKTSIDEIARDAGIAKGTVYLYFSTKEAVFRAVCETLTRRVLEATRVAASAREVPIRERLRGMLGAKYKTFFELVHRSPHAGELVDSRNRLSGALFADFDRAYVEMLARALAQAARRGELAPRRAGLDAAGAADLLACAARGIEVESASPGSERDFGPRLDRLVQLVMAALGRED